MFPQNDSPHRDRACRTITLNFLFLLIVFAIVAAIGLHTRWSNRRLRDASRLPADLSLSDHPDWPVEPGHFSVDAADFLATPDRVRAAVRLRIDTGDVADRRQAMRMTAHHLYRHLEVQAIFIEAAGADGSVDLYLFAADGRGWRGDNMVSTASSTISPT